LKNNFDFCPLTILNSDLAGYSDAQHFFMDDCQDPVCVPDSVPDCGPNQTYVNGECECDAGYEADEPEGKIVIRKYAVVLVWFFAVQAVRVKPGFNF